MTHEPPSTLLRAALDAAERGWAVFPLRPGDKRPALHGETACPGVGDCAAGHRKWEDRATTDPDRIRRAWSVRPFNIGIATGPSGLIVVDLDMPKPKNKSNSSADTPSGVTTFKALYERTGQAVPSTLRARTASGGHHLYFAVPPGVRLANTAGRLGPLIDTRAWGGYVVGAGSIVHGAAYAIADPAPVAQAPDWLLNALKPPQPPVRPVVLSMPKCGTRAAQAALERECDTVRAAPEKQGNTTLNRSTFKVGRFVAWGDIPRHEVEQAFQAAGEERGLTVAECRATIRSALDSSLRTAQPRKTA
ncbi:bifunctional DNA primase/polymerase [Streptomyces scopuliridis]|uniref:bifunctional DNA primase/polymerase n=1 Tax=Streptomyces scopuliridis TaxID=452529 RepID=UPI0035D86FAA